MLHITAIIFALISININKEPVTLTPAPVVKSDHTFVPLRGVFERLGASVDYRDGLVYAQRGATHVILKIDSPSATINGVARSLDSPPFIIGSSTYVPLRFVAEALGADVHYDAGSQRIDIYQSVSRTDAGQPESSPTLSPTFPPMKNPPAKKTASATNFDVPKVHWLHGTIDDYGNIVASGKTRYFVSCQVVNGTHTEQPLPADAITEDTTADCPESGPTGVATIAPQPKEAKRTPPPKPLGGVAVQKGLTVIKYYEVLTADGKALDVRGGPSATQAGTVVQVWDYSANSNQQWRPVRQNDGTYLIFAKNSGLVLDAVNSNQVVQSPSSGSITQRWKVESLGGTVRIRSVANGMYLSVPPAATNGTVVTLTSQPEGTWRLVLSEP